jgi:hypothetical protein
MANKPAVCSSFQKFSIPISALRRRGGGGRINCVTLDAMKQTAVFTMEGAEA